MTGPGWPPDLAARLDQTLLRPDATREEIRRFCEDGRRYGFGALFVHPCYLEDVVRLLAGTAIRIGTPVGFPFGAQPTRVKVYEAEQAHAAGAGELDMVLNIGWLRSGEDDAVREDIAAVVRATPEAGHKVILETCYLTREEKQRACALAVEAGVDYVKTSTGFGPAGATVEDVRLLAKTVGDRARVKAAGGIRDLETVRTMLRAGADRIGTSAGQEIMTAWLAGR